MIALCWMLGLAGLLVAGAVNSALGAITPGQEAAGARIEAGLAAAHVAESLVATGPTTRADDEALLRVATAYEQRADPDDFTGLTRFLSTHPHSAWRVAVLTNLGISYLHYGYLSRALDAWEAAWREGKGATARRARALVDRAVGELVRLHAELGHQERVAALLDEIGDRPVSGSATEMVQFARDTLWVMRTDPKHLYLCGPTALKMLMLAQHATMEQVKFLNQVRAGPKGTSLAQVAQLADQANVPFEPVFRKPGEKVPMPSIVHWRVGHFAAIVGEANGRFHLDDPTFGRQGVWVKREALDAEASGYFLARVNEARDADWRKVDPDEAGRVWGAGPTNDDKGNPNCGMCGYGINEQKVSLHLTDTPVGYTPPKGPSAKVTLAYAQRDQSQPANFKFFNVSQKWTLNWLSHIQDDPSAPGFNVVRLYQRDGALYSYMGYDSSTHLFAPQEDDASVLELVTTSPVDYERFLRDGSIEIYAQSDGSVVYPRNVFLTQVIDPQGNTFSLNYGKISGQVRLLSLTDATGRQTTFSYGSAISPLLITKITDPFGRSATLTYDSSERLSSITDVLGLTSRFSYDASSLIDALTTPYGTTQFAYGGSGNRRFLNIVDPLGYGEREEAFQPAPVPFSDSSYYVPQGMVALFNAALNCRRPTARRHRQRAYGRAPIQLHHDSRGSDHPDQGEEVPEPVANLEYRL
jgi:YD repeat-containing protein